MLEFRRRAELDEEAVQRLCAMGLPLRVAQLMVLRGVTTYEAAEKYLHPSLNELYDPFLLSGMQQAVDRIREAVAKKQRVCIYGDYDADGVTATSLLVLYFRTLGLNPGYYIPDRHEEGYGLNEHAVRELAAKYDLMVTVDCGVTAVKEVELCRQLGLDVLVTDHHHADTVLPDCVIVNPRLGGYPFPYLAGVGVAAKLVQALGGMDALKPYLDIVAIGTVADIVSLTDENRALVKAGLEAIAQKTRPGVQALTESAGQNSKELTSGAIGFTLGPRINAGGRIGHSSRSVEMLTTQDLNLARRIASELENHNRIRQSQEQEILKGALAQVEEQADFLNERAIVCAGEGWNAGVIGIVASRLVERYHRPAFVLAKEKNTYVGSARSVRGVSLFDQLQGISDVFLRYGGHDMAAGLTIAENRLDEFRRRINDEMLQMDDAPWVPSQDYDLEVRLPELTLEFLENLKCLEPLGQGNTMPVYLLRGVTVTEAKTMGATGAHLKMHITQDGASADAAAFKMGWRAEQAAGLMDMLVTIDKNTWNGRTSLRIYVKEFKPSQENYFTNLQQFDGKRMRDFLPWVMYNESKPGFQRTLPLPADKAADRVEHLLRINLSGTLLLYASIETAKKWEKILAARGLLQRVGLGVGHEADDRCAYNLMTCVSCLSKKQLSLYRNIVLLDGSFAPSYAEQLQAAAPGSVIQALPMQQEARDAMAAISPTIEQVRGIYKALKTMQGRLRSVGSLSAMQAALGPLCPGGQPQLQLALMEMKDMELIELSLQPFRVALREVTGKRDFYATATYQRLAGYSGPKA